jgi:hypothetical protein
MASSDSNLCVICQEAINATDNTTVPLPCMHTYHRECIKGYVCAKQIQQQDIDCPVCRQLAFQHGTSPYLTFCASLSNANKLSSDIKGQASSTPRRREPSTPVIQHVVITIPELRTFHIPENNKKANQNKWIFLILLLIAIVAVTISLVVFYM